MKMFELFKLFFQMIYFTVAVDKDLHGKGVGKSMMLHAEKWAKVKGFNAAYLMSYTHTEDFYIKCGYEEVTSGDNVGMFKKEFLNKTKP